MHNRILDVYRLKVRKTALTVSPCFIERYGREQNRIVPSCVEQKLQVRYGCPHIAERYRNYAPYAVGQAGLQVPRKSSPIDLCLASFGPASGIFCDQRFR